MTFSLTPRLRLVRDEAGLDGTFGTLFGPGFWLQTVEDDWRDNAPNESCIPAGAYLLRRTVYLKHGYETFEIVGVPGRSRCLIHPACTEEDVAGCVGVGLRRGTLVVARDEDTGAERVEKRAVVASQEAFRRFMRAMAEDDEAVIDVSWTSEVDPARLPRVDRWPLYA